MVNLFSQNAKQVAGFAAAALVQPGMLVGLGTGSTAAYFIEALGQRCKEGLIIQAIATSKQSTKQAIKANIPLIEPEAVLSLDLTVDGADEIDANNQMIKGGGGALLREKLLAYSSLEMIIIVDQAKVVKQLGKHPLPVEVCPFVYQTTIQRLKEKGYKGQLRLVDQSTPFVTDNGNFIVDLNNSSPIFDAATQHKNLKEILGVLETGLFYNVAKKVIIGHPDGTIEVRS